MARVLLSKAETRRILARLEQVYPDAKCNLVFETPFQLLVATMLLAQSTEEQVNQLTQRLFRKYPAAEDFVVLTSEELHEEIQELGIFRAKADHIIGTSARILTWYGGQVPRTQEELVRLPGVGRKTANLVLAWAYGIPTIAVETHVQRVSNRVGFTNSMNPEITEKQLCQRIPMRLWIQAQQMLVRLAKLHCTARNPDCEGCPVADVCQFNAWLQADPKLRDKVFVELGPA